MRSVYKGVLVSKSAIEILSNQNFQLAVGDDKLPGLLGRLLSVSVDDQSVEKKLGEIPSETTIEERRFLFNFFRYLWFGKENVLEIGPFLGGTTRAIALGMLNNLAYNPIEHQLLTYDQFGSYYTGESFSSFLKPLFDSGSLPLSLYEELKSETVATREFFEIFKCIHENQDYYPIISAHTGIVPDCKDGWNIENLFSVPKDSKFECIFVDGCKSWYGTKAFFMEVASTISNGGYVIFQDYGWYTCFWIPAFIEIFRDHFEQIAMVDSTYTFRLKKKLCRDDIEKKFPDSPNDLNSEIFRNIFDSVLYFSSFYGDIRQMVLGKMQLAGALAYIGAKDESKSMFIQLSNEPYARNFSALIQPKFPNLTTMNWVF